MRDALGDPSPAHLRGGGNMMDCKCKKCELPCSGATWGFDGNGRPIPLNGLDKKTCYTCRVVGEHEKKK